MVTIRWKILTSSDRTSLCLTCTSGMVRKGFRSGEEEVFCRMVTPNGLVPFPVSECTGYTDRRIPDATAGRRIGFVAVPPSGESEDVEIVPASSISVNTET